MDSGLSFCAGVGRAYAFLVEVYLRCFAVLFGGYHMALCLSIQALGQCTFYKVFT